MSDLIATVSDETLKSIRKSENHSNEMYEVNKKASARRRPGRSRV